MIDLSRYVLETITQDEELVLGTKDVECIVDAFYATEQQGLSMGLAISQSVAEAPGGRLWAANTEQGAIFQFASPIRDGGRA